MGFAKFSQEPNVLFVFDLSRYMPMFPMKAPLVNPFTGQTVWVIFKKLTKNQTSAIYVEGTKAGEIRGG